MKRRDGNPLKAKLVFLCLMLSSGPLSSAQGIDPCSETLMVAEGIVVRPAFDWKLSDDRVRAANNNLNSAIDLTKQIDLHFFSALDGRRFQIRVLDPEYYGNKVLTFKRTLAIVPIPVKTAADVIRAPVIEIHYQASSKGEAIAIYSEIINRYNYWLKRLREEQDVHWTKAPLPIQEHAFMELKDLEVAAREVNMDAGKIRAYGHLEKGQSVFNVRLFAVERRLSMETFATSLELLSALLFTGITVLPEHGPDLSVVGGTASPAPDSDPAQTSNVVPITQFMGGFWKEGPK